MIRNCNDKFLIGDEIFVKVNNERIVNKYLVKFYNSKNYGLYQCYKNPSENKVLICLRWESFARHQHCYNMCILSYNSRFFTIGMEVDICNETYLLVITPTKHYAIKER